MSVMSKFCVYLQMHGATVIYGEYAREDSLGGKMLSLT